jgi:hypothetical protein
MRFRTFALFQQAAVGVARVIVGGFGVSELICFDEPLLLAPASVHAVEAPAGTAF